MSIKYKQYGLKAIIFNATIDGGNQNKINNKMQPFFDDEDEIFS